MASRHVRCTCESCGAIWRMANSHIVRAQESTGGMRCPVCYEPSTVGDVGLADTERAKLHAICRRVVEDHASAVRDINRERAKRFEEIRRRAHGRKLNARVHARGGRP